MKKIVSLFLLLIFIAYFLCCPQQAFYATQEGILLWFEKILPTLLPFSVFSYIFMESGTLDALERRLPQGFPLCEAYILFCGFLFGFPIGSKLSADFYTSGRISRQKAQILCTCANNLSPVFVSTYVLTQCLKMPERTLSTYLILYLIPLISCVILLVRAETAPASHKKTASRFHLNMKIIDAGILNGFETLIKLCGYIVLFRIVIEMLKLIPAVPAAGSLLLFGMTEVTNGISCISNAGLSPQTAYLLSIGATSFGGLCGMAQTGSMIAATDLSLGYYLRGKLLLTLLCTMAAFILF